MRALYLWRNPSSGASRHLLPPQLGFTRVGHLIWSKSDKSDFDGRREERRRISARHHPPTVFDPHGEERVARLEPCRPQTGLHPSRRARCALLRMRSGMCDVVCDCPTGKSLKTCPAPCIKIFRFAPTPNHPYNSGHPAPTRGAYRDRHGRWVRGAVAAARRARNTSSQGELAHERRPRADERRDRGRQSRVVLAPVAGVKPAEVLRNPTGF